MLIRGGRLTFSLHKAIPPSFALHKAKAPPLKAWRPLNVLIAAEQALASPCGVRGPVLLPP
jgi:hypothetical protein